MASTAYKTYRVFLLAASLLGFFLAIDLLGQAFNLFGEGFAEKLIAGTSNPFVALFVGILSTAIVQSSSSTTSLTVALVAAGALTVEGAIPIVMGANIGTSVTNTFVSLGHVTRRGEFERAFAGATIHDLFNLMSVAILLPLELATGFLSSAAVHLADGIAEVGGLNLLDPVKLVVRPISEWVIRMLGRSPVLTLLVALGLLFAALKLLVDLLKALMSGKAERVLHETLFRSPVAAIAAGLAITVMVQSSSITTSIMIPLVAAGIVTLEQVFPFTVGANIGTTVTALIAALSTGNVAAVTVACSHMLFNVLGTLFVYVPPPIRKIPIACARALGRLTVRNRMYAVGYVLLVFFILPAILIFASTTWGS